MITGVDFQDELARLSTTRAPEKLGDFVLYAPGTASQVFWTLFYNGEWLRILFEDRETALALTALDSRLEFNKILNAAESLLEPLTWDILKTIIREHT